LTGGGRLLTDRIVRTVNAGANGFLAMEHPSARIDEAPALMSPVKTLIVPKKPEARNSIECEPLLG
jgi:hypothetical protein